MKQVTINSVEHFENRSKVCIQVQGEHNEYVTAINAIHAIAKKYNVQDMLFENRSSLIYNKLGNAIGFTHGNTGGTITFHSHSCNPKEAAQELINFANNEN